MLTPATAGKAVFVPLQQAQAAYAGASSNLAAAIAAEFGRRGLAAHSSTASLEPLDKVAAPALAIELSSPDGTPAGGAAPDYQRQVAAAIAAAIAGTLPQTGGAH
jgi:hypothetical protein